MLNPKRASLITVASFNAANGANPLSGLYADGQGNLFGTTQIGGALNSGTIYEVIKTSSGYASSPRTIASLSWWTNGGAPQAKLIADSQGNLFGTARDGGVAGFGAVFELPKTASGYAAAPSMLVSFKDFDGAFPQAELIIDRQGNLFGTTTSGGTSHAGTVFEVTKHFDGYDASPTTLFSFDIANGADPRAGLITDNQGNILGTTASGGLDTATGTGNAGTVFEVIKTASGYSSAPTTLVAFNGINGAEPVASLVSDSQGNLFGTTVGGGTNPYGTVFEIKKISSGYAPAVTTLVNFNGTNGGGPVDALIVDSEGNLFGTTSSGGRYDKGTVFEIAKTANGYASTPTTLISFKGIDGASPEAGLLVDSLGNFFGTTALGGAYNRGTVFEITNTGFVTSASVIALNAPTGTAHSTHPTITGYTNTSFAGTRVNLYEGTHRVGTATVGADGSFSAAVTLANGLHSITATHTDAARTTITSDAQSVLVMVPTTAGALNLATDLTLADTDLAGVTGLSAINFRGHGASSIVLGANAAADFGANTIKVTAAAGALSLGVDGHALTAGFTAKGGNGADVFIGGSGNDTFTGGAGADLFDLSQGGRDLIADFVHGTDHIRFADHSRADLHISYSRGKAAIIIDSAHQATLNNIAAGSLTASDFIFS